MDPLESLLATAADNREKIGSVILVLEKKKAGTYKWPCIVCLKVECWPYVPLFLQWNNFICPECSIQNR